MKKYIKPEIQVYNFDIRTSLMDVTASPTPGPTANTYGLVRSSVVSTNMNYIPTDVTNKAWSTFGDDDWGWYN